MDLLNERSVLDNLNESVLFLTGAARSVGFVPAAEIYYKVTYNGNGNTSGTAPVDPVKYPAGSTVTVLGNTGDLEKTDYLFEGWSTVADGYVTVYEEGETFKIFADTTLYAAWFLVPEETPSAPFNLIASAGNREVSIRFLVNDGGSPIINMSYSINGGSFIFFDPAQPSSPVTISNLINDRQYNIQLKATNRNGTGPASLPVSVTPVLCFNEGTLILSLNDNLIEEYVPIEKLEKGDWVKTYKYGYRKIDIIKHGSLINNHDSVYKCMYKMEKTDTNGLIEDLIVTGGHSVLVDDLGEYLKPNNTMWNQEQRKKVIRGNKKIDILKDRINNIKDTRDKNINRTDVVNKFNERLVGLESKLLDLQREVEIASLKEDETPQIDGKYLLLASVSKDFEKLENQDIYTWYHFSLENDGEDDRRYGVWANGILSETPSKNQIIKMDLMAKD
uniref:Fibronectin type-III domain-containing protein n=1 Tax=viral metagenome TaxID=1070528 RepID=A0A6C0LNJ6_9ZZZZ